jgi:hypothetical protein
MFWRSLLLFLTCTGGFGEAKIKWNFYSYGQLYGILDATIGTPGKWSLWVAVLGFIVVIFGCFSRVLVP